MRYNHLLDNTKTNSSGQKLENTTLLRSGIRSDIPGVIFSSFPTARLQTFPRTLGGNPCHHNSRTLLVDRLQRGERWEKEKRRVRLLEAQPFSFNKISLLLKSKPNPKRCVLRSSDSFAILPFFLHLRAPQIYVQWSSNFKKYFFLEK